MTTKTIVQALHRAEELGLELGIGVLAELQAFAENQGSFSDELSTTCDKAAEVLREAGLYPLATKLEKACVELSPASFTL